MTTTDVAIAAGRELWGYPKKYADITLTKSDEKVIGKAVRNGVEIIRVECQLHDSVEPLLDVTVTPHLNLHTVPNPDGPGIYSMRVISRDTSPDFQLRSQEYGNGLVKLQSIPGDPLKDFGPIEIIGAGITIGDFYATEQNGWGNIIDILK